MEGKKYSNKVVDLHYKDGIMYFTYKQGKFTLDEVKEVMEDFFREFADVLPVLAVSDISAQKGTPKEHRDFAATDYVIDKFRANALVADSVFSKMVGNLFLTFNKPKKPTRIFSDIASAETWLRTLE
jgi:hypothetical protein